MGTGPVPPGALVTPALLSRFNVPSSFLAQFAPRPYQIQVLVPGVLGTVQFQWQYPGDSAWSAPIVSTAGAAWAFTLDDTFTDLTFAAATYNLNDTYTVDANGAVSGPSANITAARFDLRQNACSAVTAEAMTLMRDAIHPPLLTWGDDATTHAAAWAYEVLKRGRGMAPEDAAVGDANVLTGGELARKYFASIGENGRPDSMTDSSPTVDGPLIPVYPYGDPPRNW
ncbi:MAG: hypothetical protein ACRETD_06580 [Steroidobacteraceae bacterium]